MMECASQGTIIDIYGAKVGAFSGKDMLTIDDFDLIDGRYANNSNAKGLSLGLAQWNERGKVAISAKAWRHTGEKWSRQSEETLLHRVLDLAILICQSKLYFLQKVQ